MPYCSRLKKSSDQCHKPCLPNWKVPVIPNSYNIILVLHLRLSSKLPQRRMRLCAVLKKFSFKQFFKQRKSYIRVLHTRRETVPSCWTSVKESTRIMINIIIFVIFIVIFVVIVVVIIIIIIVVSRAERDELGSRSPMLFQYVFSRSTGLVS